MSADQASTNFPEDTQWPRFQVFVQEKEGHPFQDAGSVHASDPEMAMMNARDVFVRRPECAALWIVPASQITARTAEEMPLLPLSFPSTSLPVQSYHLFAKNRHNGTHIHVTSLDAHSPEEALKLGWQAISSSQAPLSLWAVPASAVMGNDPEDAASFFTPAQEKTFRLSNDFHTVSAMRQIKNSAKDTPSGGSGLEARQGESTRE